MHRGIVTAITSGASAALPVAIAAEPAIPDFTGVWGRDSVTFESPTSGPGPVVSRTHTVDALAGDYSNPVLQP